MYDQLQSQNDGNKVFKFEKVTKSLTGDTCKNYGAFIQSWFDDQDEVYVWINISVDTTKHVQPIAVKPKETPAAPSKVDTLADASSKFKTMTKYTFYESGEKYVKVLLDFPGAKKLLTTD